jgi:hypothetical protein
VFGKRALVLRQRRALVILSAVNREVLEQAHQRGACGRYTFRARDLSRDGRSNLGEQTLTVRIGGEPV